jgi:hypothetical protein
MVRSHCLLAAFALLAPAAVAQNDALAVQKGSTLTITGGDGVDDFLLQNVIMLADGDAPLEGVQIGIMPRNGTTVNGHDDVVNFTGVKKLNINLGDGDDIVEIAALGFDVFPLTLHAGDGNDSISFLDVGIGTVKLFGDDGNDSFEADFATFGETRIVGGPGTLGVNFDSVVTLGLRITGGPEADSLVLDDLDVSGPLKLNLLQGDDSVVLTDIGVNQAANVALSTGENTFQATDVSWGVGLSVAGGPDADTVNFTDSQIGESLKLRLGPGSNSLGLFSVDDPMQVGEDLVIAGGPDDDLVNISASDIGTLTQIGARTRLSLKPGVNQCFSIGNVQYGEDFRYAGGPDDDTLSLNGNTVGTDVTLLVSNGTNGVGIFGTDIGDDLTVKAGSGDDSVQIDMASTIGGKQTLILGSGNNTQP